MNDALPDFVGIGALKAGTTFLDTLLRGHPQLSFPRFLKEAEYFTRHYDRGPEWYAELFPEPNGRLRGEISPQYMSDPLAPGRVWDANPEVRILANLRNPVTRAVSQYRHWVQETGYERGFTTFLAEHPNAFERSQYHRALTPWLERFGRDQLDLIVFEDLVTEPVATVQGVLRFLCVDDSYVPPDATTPVNATFSPRFPRTYALAKRAGNRLRTGEGARLVHLVKRARLNALLMAASSESRAAEVTPAERDDLAARLRPDVERVSELMDRDLAAEWLSS